MFTSNLLSRNHRRSRRRGHQATGQMLEARVVLNASPIVVNTALDDVTPDNGLLSLREAIELANQNEGADEIRFARGGRGEIVLDSGAGELTITDDLTIRGPGQTKLTVSGGGTTRVFSVLPNEDQVSPEVTIKNLTIANGLATDAPSLPLAPLPGLDPSQFALGGGLFNVGGKVHLDRVRMTGNQTSGVFGFGGAVANMFEGDLKVTRSSFEDNLAFGFAIAVGGAIENDTFATLTVEQSEFRNNTASAFLGAGEGFQGAAVGGAIKLSGGSEATIRHSLFEGNVAAAGHGADGTGQAGGFGAGGGALTVQAVSFFVFPPTPSHLEVSHSVIANNRAIGGNGGSGSTGGAGGSATAGGLATWAGTAIVKHSRFINNQAIGGTGGASSEGIGGAGGLAAGGAMDNGFPSFGTPELVVSHSLLLGNEALGGNGGAGSIAGPGGAALGGAISNTIDQPGFAAGSVAISHSTIALNRAKGGMGGSGGAALGGGIYNITSGQTILRRSVVIGNRAEGGAGDSAGSDGPGLGGGIYNDVDGLFATDLVSRFFTQFNSASTALDNIFGDLDWL